MTTGNFAEWLATVSTCVPPIKISKARLDQMNEKQRAELEALNKRGMIDPRKINQFIDPAKEVPRRK